MCWQLHGPKLHFRGARGVQSINRLAKAAGLLFNENVVFMCVCSMHLGRKIQTKQKGFFEKHISQRLPGIQMVTRMFDENLHIRLRYSGKGWLHKVKKNNDFDFPLTEIPTSLHIRIAFHGHVQMRVGFNDVQWSETLETATLKICSYLQDKILECC